METLDLRVLQQARDWIAAGQGVTLFTVVATWGSAPRPVGALLAIRADGVLCGSVSGGCVEDDLVARVRAAHADRADHADCQLPQSISYGVTSDEAARFGLPCGGTLLLVAEPLYSTEWIDALLARIARQRLVARTLDMGTGAVALADADADGRVRWDGNRLVTIFGPQWRALLIGAGQLSQVLAPFLGMLGFAVLVCDPRVEYVLPADGSLGQRVAGMPDDAVRDLAPDRHTAVIALTHDPKLDDMALIEALQSAAFYVGALGSRRNQAARRERLHLHFGLTTQELDRLHGPVGMAIGARAPAEIAIAIAAEIVAERNLLRADASTAVVQGVVQAAPMPPDS